MACAFLVTSLAACDTAGVGDAGTDAMVVLDAAATRDAAAEASALDAYAHDAGPSSDAGPDAASSPDAGSDAGPIALCPAMPPIADPPERLYVAPGGSDSAAGTMAAPLA